jgi:hypothetical protein
MSDIGPESLRYPTTSLVPMPEDSSTAVTDITNMYYDFSPNVINV